MQAHGYLPGPTHRPLLTGALTGLLASFAALPLLYASGAWHKLSEAVSLRPSMTLVVYIAAMTGAGLLYARIFLRAANDVRGGWLFGISYGFLLWMLGPVTLLQWFNGAPIATGNQAKALMGAQLLYGLVLGTAFPWVHRILQPKLGGRLKLTGATRTESPRTARSKSDEPAKRGVRLADN